MAESVAAGVAAARGADVFGLYVAFAGAKGGPVDRSDSRLRRDVDAGGGGAAENLFGPCLDIPLLD